MHIMAQKVDEQLDWDRCSASTKCKMLPTSTFSATEEIILLHGLHSVGVWAWDYLKQLSFLADLEKKSSSNCNIHIIIEHTCEYIF